VLEPLDPALQQLEAQAHAVAVQRARAERR
jgi:hypothetical protein